MPIYDYYCDRCKTTDIDVIAGVDDDPRTGSCGHQTRRIISMSGTNQNTANDDADWIHHRKTGAVAVFRNDDHPAAQRFVKDPTRANLNRVMKAKGLRHVEAGESVSGDRKRREADHERGMGKLRKKLIDKARKDRQIDVRTS